jgi:hypothetical protein
LIALAYNLQLLFDEERDAAVTNRALVTFFGYLPQEPEGPGEADAPPAEIDMDKLSKQARHYGMSLVRNAASMQRFPSISLVNYARTGLRQFRAGTEADAMHAVLLLLGRLLLADSTWAELHTLLTLPAEGVDAALLSKAKGQLAALLTGADAQDAEGTRGVITLLGALGLAAKVDPPSDLSSSSSRRSRPGSPRKARGRRTWPPGRRRRTWPPRKRKEKEDQLTDTEALAAKANALAAETKAWEAEVEQGMQGALKAAELKLVDHRPGD